MMIVVFVAALTSRKSSNKGRKMKKKKQKCLSRTQRHVCHACGQSNDRLIYVF